MANTMMLASVLKGVVVALASLASPASPGTPEGPGLSAAPLAHAEVHAALSKEVRLRKLHLVRPDLIPFPIVYEVYC